jgi:peptidyl-prolyl cis-trans isomerase A (cyclophilin A)
MIRVFAAAAAAFAALALALASVPAVGQAAAPAPAPAAPQVTNERAPDMYKVRLDTNEGPIVIEVTRAWAPNGADRFYNLVKSGYFDEARFFRVLPGFMVQFGINADPNVSAAWRRVPLQDDPVKESNKRGYVTFATAGPNTRTTQVFINYNDQNAALDRQGFAPFGRVISGMDVAEKLYSGYGEGAPNGPGPDQQLTQAQGNAYLNRAFPMLDFIRKATIEP